MNKDERNEKIELYGRGYDLLKAALAEVPQEAMKFKPTSKDWSVYEIIVHIADSETNAALRARKLIVEPGGMLMGYDQDKWAVELNYHDHDLEDALEATRIARKTTYRLLKTVLDEVFDTHWLKHPEMESQYTFEKWINIYSAHIPGHIDQIKGNMTTWKKANNK
jgi:hypothetical protein